MRDEPRRKTRYRGERCTSKLTLNVRMAEFGGTILTPEPATAASIVGELADRLGARREGQGSERSPIGSSNGGRRKDDGHLRP